MAVIYNSSKVVTDGLVFCLDIANPRCEVDSTKIKDVIVKDEITLVNGPEFSPNYGGGLVFDGANDYTHTDIPEVNFTGVDEDFTLDIVCRSLDSSAPTAASSIKTDGWSLGNFYGHVWNWRIAGPDEGGRLCKYLFPYDWTQHKRPNPLPFSIMESTSLHWRQSYKNRRRFHRLR